MPDLPTGTVTFLFTDIEGSTRLLQHLGERYPAVLEVHHRLLRAAFQQAGGCEIGTQGDEFFVSFPRATDAVAAAVAAQRALAAHPWPEGAPVRVRMGLHTGEPTLTATGYVGLDVHRAARIGAAGYGGQILLSQTTRDLVEAQLPEGVSLRELGAHRLQDLQRPEPLFQLVIAGLAADFPPLKTLDLRARNLPVQLTPLLGREAELAAGRERLLRPEVRLVTLTGPGGTGKTRLGLQLAADLLDEFEDGAYFVSLAPIRDPALVGAAIAQTLGVRETAGQPILESLKEYLQPRKLLLVLDNFEQVTAAALLVAELLSAAPRLKVLVTSRAALHLQGEHEFPVPPLALPDRRQLPPLNALSQYAAVALFIQRALAVKPDFTVTNRNAPAVAEICYRLEGLPLAIELAAARIRFLPPQALLSRLENRLKLLVGGARDLPARQQTLRNTLAWSYDLLDEGEQRLFRRLSVFVGGCSLEAAEGVYDAGGDLEFDVLEGVASLVDKSLLRQEEGPTGEPRFTMLETLREFGLERLGESGELEEIRWRHARWYLSLAESGEAQSRGPDLPIWVNRLEVEHDNIRAAFDWMVENGEAREGLRWGTAVYWFWSVRGYLEEGRQRLAALLAMPGAEAPTAARASALGQAADLIVCQGDHATARLLEEERLAINRALGDKRGIAASLESLAMAPWQGDYEAAYSLYQESLAIQRELGENVANTLFNLGHLVCHHGEHEAARSLFQESLALWREVADIRGVALALQGLGLLAYHQGDYKGAWRPLEESLAMFQEIRDRPRIAASLESLAMVALRQGEVASARGLLEQSLSLLREVRAKHPILRCLEGLAAVASAQGQPERAARLFGAAEALRETTAIALEPAGRVDYDRDTAATRAVLGEEAFTVAWAAGRAMTLEQAMEDALQGPGARSLVPPD